MNSVAPPQTIQGDGRSDDFSAFTQTRSCACPKQEANKSPLPVDVAALTDPSALGDLANSFSQAQGTSEAASKRLLDLIATAPNKESLDGIASALGRLSPTTIGCGQKTFESAFRSMKVGEAASARQKGLETQGINAAAVAAAEEQRATAERQWAAGEEQRAKDEALNKERLARVQREKEAAARQSAERAATTEQQRLARLVPHCKGKILSQEDFVMGMNPYADAGKCVEIKAARTIEMQSATSGLFDIGVRTPALVTFNDAFRGMLFAGVAKITGTTPVVRSNGDVYRAINLQVIEVYSTGP